MHSRRKSENSEHRRKEGRERERGRKASVWQSYARREGPKQSIREFL